MIKPWRCNPVLQRNVTRDAMSSLCNMSAFINQEITIETEPAPLIENVTNTMRYVIVLEIMFQHHRLKNENKKQTKKTFYRRDNSVKHMADFYPGFPRGHFSKSNCVTK